jgi:hypothetical protein
MFKRISTHGRWDIPKKEILKMYENFKENYSKNLLIAKELLKSNDLKFSLEEIDQFGELYATFHSNPEKLGLTYDELLDVFIEYYGEAWMFYFGGYWVYTTDRKVMHYGYPCIIDYGPPKQDWVGIPPHNYAYIIENHSKGLNYDDDFFSLSRIIKRHLDVYESQGVKNYKRTEREFFGKI